MCVGGGSGFSRKQQCGMFTFNEFLGNEPQIHRASVVSCFSFVPPNRIKTLCATQRVTVDDGNAHGQMPVKKKKKVEAEVRYVTQIC